MGNFVRIELAEDPDQRLCMLRGDHQLALPHPTGEVPVAQAQVAKIAEGNGTTCPVAARHPPSNRRRDGADGGGEGGRCRPPLGRLRAQARPPPELAPVRQSPRAASRTAQEARQTALRRDQRRPKPVGDDAPIDQREVEQPGLALAPVVPDEVAQAVGHVRGTEPSRALQTVGVRSHHDGRPGAGEGSRQRLLIGGDRGRVLLAPVQVDHRRGAGRRLLLDGGQQGGAARTPRGSEAGRPRSACQYGSVLSRKEASAAKKANGWPFSVTRWGVNASARFRPTPRMGSGELLLTRRVSASPSAPKSTPWLLATETASTPAARSAVSAAGLVRKW